MPAEVSLNAFRLRPTPLIFIGIKDLHRLGMMQPGQSCRHGRRAFRRAIPGHTYPRANRRGRGAGRNQYGPARIEQDGMQRIAAGDILTRFRMRHHGQIIKARLLRDDIFLPPHHGFEGQCGAFGFRGSVGIIGQRHIAQIGGEFLEQVLDAIRPFPAFAFGGGHHFFDHRAGKPFPGKRRDIPRIHAHMQAMHMRTPDACCDQRSAQRGFTRSGAGQRQQ